MTMETNTTEFFDAVKRHLCSALGFDFGLIDVVRAHEVINLTSFVSDDSNEDANTLSTSLCDEHQQPLLVSHTLIAQKVKQTKKHWVGRAWRDDKPPQGYLYVIIPILDTDASGKKAVIGMLRMVSFDETRQMSSEQIAELKQFAANLASRMIPLANQPAAKAKEDEGKQAPTESVLLIVSDRLARRRFARVLESHYQVTDLEVIEKIGEALMEHTFDLVVLESKFLATGSNPVVELLKESREGGQLSVVAVIPSTEQETLAAALENGASDCIFDNAPEEELLARVRAALSNIKYQRELVYHSELLENYAKQLASTHEELARIKQAKHLEESFLKETKESQELALRKANTQIDLQRREAEKRHGQDQLLHRISNSIRKSFDIKSTNIEEMLDTLAGYFNLDACFLVLPSEEHEDDTIRAQYVSDKDYDVKSKNLDLQILQTFKEHFNWDTALFVSDVARERRPEVFIKGPLHNYPLISLFYVPITYEEKLLGLLCGHRCETQAQWSQDNVSFFRQVADQIASGVANARLYSYVQRQATTDGLTGLFNHRTAQEKLAEQLRVAERYQRKLSLIMLDVDHFKAINDNHGHQAGDAVLKSVAKLIRNACRDVDIPARYGGEEFLLILPEVNQEGAAVLAERIRTRLEDEKIRYEDLEISVTASFGIASFPDDSKNQDQLIELADRALYMSKRMGRNQVHIARDLLFQKYIPKETKKASTSTQSAEATAQELEAAEEHASEVVDMIKSLATSLYSRSEYNKVHHLETTRFAELLAKVYGLAEPEIEQVRVATLLHDVGLLSVSDEIINKQQPLTEEEFAILKKHPEMGADLLRPVKALKDVCDILEYHHEFWDGTGYPRGLKGEEIPLAARIVAIVDAYHAMISDRPYRKALSEADAVNILKNGAGKQFDPFLVDMFVAVLDNLQVEHQKP